MYHIVCPAKYRKAIFTEEIDRILKLVCAEIALRYDIEFLEIGADKNHVHFLVQSVPMYSPTKIVRTIKSITAREIFKRAPDVKKQLWGGELWSDGYYISTVGKHGNETRVATYVKNQGNEYQLLHKQEPKKTGQMMFF